MFRTSESSSTPWAMRRTMVVVAAVLLIASGICTDVQAAPAVPAWRLTTPWTTEQAVVTVGTDTITAEIADSNELRSRGLGYRDGLVPGMGMLFVFDEASLHTFWMKGMRFCLDIVWIEQGTVRGAAESVCPVPGANDAELPRYPSPEPVTYVLELPAGWLQSHGYGAGTPVTIQLPN
jgi:uncharacterized membrane protein (UPF0127 family)